MGDRQGTVPGSESPSNGAGSGPLAPLIEVSYYTDPLCCWSWVFEPQWRRLRSELGVQLTWRNVMGGMIPDWESFSDPVNAIHRPAQMGPHWYQVRQLTGMPLDERIWTDDPPTSSYPAGIAFKAAERQSPATGEVYLRRLREAVMIDRRNIARREVLLSIAEDVASDPVESGALDLERFRHDLDGDEVLDAFREDLKDTRYQNIGRFPTLVIHRVGGPSVIVVGYRPYPLLDEALRQVAPELPNPPRTIDLIDYFAHWRRAIVVEVAEALHLETDQARELLECAVADGHLIKTTAGYTLHPNASGTR